MEIRLAEMKDLSELIRLHSQSVNELCAITPAGFEFNDPQLYSKLDYEGQFKAKIEQVEGQFVFVAFKDSKLIGFLTGVIEEWPDSLLKTPYGTIEYVEVDESHRGSGVASALIETAEGYLKEMGVRSMDILTWETNSAAVSLYKSLGYQTIEYRMAKQLKE